MTARSIPRSATWRRSTARICVAATAATLLVGVPTAEAEPLPATPVVLHQPLTSTDSETASASMAAPGRAAVADRVAAAQRASRAAAQRAVAARQARFTQFTLSSPQTRDMRGVEPSLYRGRFFRPAAEERRLCIVKRESEGHYDVVNPSGSYFGAYQVSKALARGVTFMMAREHRQLMGEAKAKDILGRLRGRPMNTWPRYWQDAAFHTIMNWDGTLSGASHWAGGRWSC